MLDGYRVVDLTLPIGPDTVMWPGCPAPEAEVGVTLERDGFYARRVMLWEHTGTHFDAPCHMVEGPCTHEVPAETLVCPAVVIDISGDLSPEDVDAVLTVEQVQRWEAEHGAVPEGSAVLLRTGWEEFSADPYRYGRLPGDLRFPGFGVESARYLVDERRVAGLGIDTLGIDAGVAAEFPVHKQVSLPKGVWHLENLTNLKSVPPTGALVMAGVLKLVDGSGSPARVLALVP